MGAINAEPDQKQDGQAVRGTGGYIKGTNGESQGVIPFLKLHNDQLLAVNQGGKRKGSGCAYLETWHNDVYDFLQLRLGAGDERRRTLDMNTANWIPDLFMKRVNARQVWTLFRSNEVPDLHELYGRAFETRYAEYEAKAAAGEMMGRQYLPALQTAGPVVSELLAKLPGHQSNGSTAPYWASTPFCQHSIYAKYAF